MFTPLQEDIHSRLEKALGQIESLNNNNLEMKQEVEDIEKDLERLDEKKKIKNPGVAVNTMLKKMAAEPTYTTEEMYAYASELWLTAEKFEEELAKEQNGMRMELQLSKE